MRTERYNIALTNGLIGTGNKEAELLKSIILDFFKMERKDAEKQFGVKTHTEYCDHMEFMYGLSYGRLTPDNLMFIRRDDENIELMIFINDQHISTPSGIVYSLNCLFKKMIDETISIEYLEPEYELVLLGPVKQPEYCHGQDWYDEENERVTKYHINYCDGGRSSYHVGDSFIHGSHLEVYGGHLFYDESEIDEYLQDNYPDIKEYEH